MGAPLLEIHDLQKHFLVKKSFSAQNRVYLKAVDGVDLTMEKGETIGLVGESGCGKSTLGRTILKLHSVTGGQIVYEGKDITKYTPDQMMEYRRKMQLINFQDPFASLNPRKTIMAVGGGAAGPLARHPQGGTPRAGHQDAGCCRFG